MQEYSVTKLACSTSGFVSDTLVLSGAGAEEYAKTQGLSLVMLAAVRLPQFRARLVATFPSLVQRIVAGCPDDDLAGQMVRVYVRQAAICESHAFERLQRHPT